MMSANSRSNSNGDRTAIFPRLNSGYGVGSSGGDTMTSSRAQQPVEERLADQHSARGSCQRAGGNPLHRLASYDPYRLPIGAPAADAAAVGGGAAEHARVHF
jgi:hypothetical protein